jgi:uncharacterized repeat protein (TIGR03803 family)
MNVYLLVCLLLAGMLAKLPAQTAQTLCSFSGTNGSDPQAALTQGADGNFYGTTLTGGASGKGTVFEVTTNGTLTRLVSFNGTNGMSPAAALIRGPDGYFYGATLSGGASYTNDTNTGYGTLFKMTNGTLTTLVSFSGTNGDGPIGLTLGPDGNFYGATLFGGSNYLGATNVGFGTLFRLATNGAFTPLVSFDGTNGESPNPLTLGKDGNFYGTTSTNGLNDYGTAFELSTNGAFTTLAAFNYTCAYPMAALTAGNDGNFYGTTEQGGTNGEGTIFKLTTNGALTTLVSFNQANEDYNEGAYPTTALTLGHDGNFYGTTYGGGSGGTLFRVTTNGILTTLVSFNGDPDAALTLGVDGYYYGTTAGATNLGDGTVFVLSISPPAITQPPQNQVQVAGQSASFSVAASGSPPLAYQWYFTNSAYQSTAGAVVQSPYGFYGFIYDVVVTNGGSGYTTVPNVQFVGGGGSGASGTATVGNGMVTAIAVAANGNGSNYTNPPTVLIDPPNGLLIGQTSNTLNLSAIAPDNAGGYFVVISNSFGSVTSSVAGLSVNYPPSILQPPQSQGVFLGSNVVFTVTPDGTPPFGYQWWAVAGQLSNATAVPVVFSGFVVTCNITSGGAGYLAVPAVQFMGGSGSGAAGTAVLSNRMVTAIMTVSPGSGYATPPTVLIAPPAALSLTGQTGSNLLLTAVTNGNAANYFVVVTNNFGCVTSSVATLTITGIVPQSTVLTATNGVLSLQFTGTPNYPYVLQTTTNLAPPIIWQSIVTNLADVNGHWSFSVTNPAYARARFYRAGAQ